MNLRSIGFALLLVGCLGACERGPARISIPDLLRPETRLSAFQHFQIRAHREEAKDQDWANLKEFAEWHHDLTLVELHGGNGPPRYLVTWHTSLKPDDWEQGGVQAQPASSTDALLLPRTRLSYQLFSAEGVPIADEKYIRDGAIADVDGDGEPELIEREASPVTAQISDSEPTGSNGEVKTTCEFLLVRPLGLQTATMFAVLYNTHPESRAAANSWGYQVHDSDGDGIYEIELGPVVAPEGVEPKVTIRWDKEKRAWQWPEAKPGDHFRILQGGDAADQAQRIASEGGLGYPLAPAPAVPAAALEVPERFHGVERIPPERLSKPYSYHSLANLSDEQLFAYMAGNRNAWDYAGDRMTEATTVPDFWKLDPQAAALAYVQHNRPPALAGRYLLAVSNPRGEAAPAEGDLTLSDGPSGCFAPGGAIIHHLHCAREGSFLAYTESLHFWAQVLPWENRNRFEFRKLELPYEQARHILQTVWWLSHIRSRQLTNSNSEYTSGGSSSDGSATVQIASPGQRIVLGGARSAAARDTFLGVGTMNEDYDVSAFINLTVQLFRREVPERLGKPWQSQAIPMRWNDTRNLPEDQSAEELTRVHDLAAEFLRLYRERKVAAPIATVAAGAVGDMGWRDLQADVEQLVPLLPPLLPHERRLAQIATDLEWWKGMLGEDASEKAHNKREAQQTTTIAFPGANIPDATSPDLDLTPKPKEEPVPPVPPVQKAMLEGVDALYKERDALSFRAPKGDKEIAELRGTISWVSRQLNCFDQPEALFQWAVEDQLATSFALSRLAQLDRELASQLLLRCEFRATRESNRKYYADSREQFERGETASSVQANDGPLSDEERADAIAKLRDPETSWDEIGRVVAAVVPASDPHRYPDPAIDAALLELVARESRLGEPAAKSVLTAAARRLGGRAWDALAKKARKIDYTRIPLLSDCLPALTLIAQSYPDSYRTRLRDLLAPELHSTHGYLNRTFCSLWQADLRELKADLERIATGGPDDYEGDQASGASSEESPVKFRYHRARQIVALWNEEDLLTRARLLVAFASVNAGYFSDEQPGAMEQLQHQLNELQVKLTPAQKDSLTGFVRWCESHAAEKLADRGNSAQITAVVLSVRSSLGVAR